MAKETNRDFEQIERPYNNFLERSDQTAEGADSILGGNTKITEGGSRETEAISSNPNGSVETQPVKSDGGMGDIWIKNFIRSDNWKPKSVGFNIDGLTGKAEFSGVYVSGHIEATSGSFSGTITAGDLHIPDQDTTANSFHINTSGDTWWGATETDFNADNDNATAYVLKSGVAKFQNVNVTGVITISSGSGIANLSDAGALAVLDTVGTAEIDLVAVTSNELASNAVEEAKIAADAVTAAKIAVSGLDGTTGDVAANHIVANMLQVDSVTAAKIQADSVTAPKINVVGLDGISGRIVVADVTDADVLTGGINNYATTNIEAGKIVISGATNLEDWRNTTDLTKIEGGSIATNTITATQIDANTITANEIAVGAITATEMTVTILSAIAVDMGSLTAGDITLNTSGFIRGGQTAYETGTGFFLGYDVDTYKFSIGDQYNSLTWDGNTFNVKGILQAGKASANGWLSDGSLSLISGSAVVSNALLSTSIQTGVTVNSQGTIYSKISAVGMFGSYVPEETLNASIRFQGSAILYNTIGNGIGPISFLGISNIVNWSLTSTIFTGHHIGFFITFEATGLPKIYASNANGTTQTLTDTGILLSNTAFTTFRIEKISSSNINFYINDVLVVTHTTNISASNAAYYITASCANNAVTAESGLGFGNYELVSV